MTTDIVMLVIVSRHRLLILSFTYDISFHKRSGVPQNPEPAGIHRIGEVSSLTWSFSGPDGRALVTISPDTDGEPLLTWLAVGYHDIYS